MKLGTSARTAAALVAVAVLSTSCKNPVGDFNMSGTVTPPRTATVAIRSSGFDPAAVTVQPGGQVTFENRDGVARQIVSSCSELNTPSIAPGSRLPIAMRNSVGSCTYHDPADPAKIGTIQLCHNEGLFRCD